METAIRIPEGLYDDEAVNFMADRYKTTPEYILESFMVQDGIKPAKKGLNVPRLENNEMEIIRGLISTYNI